MRNAKFNLSIFIIVLPVFLMGCAAKNKAAPSHGPRSDYGAVAKTVIRDVSYIEGKAASPLQKLDVYSNPHEGVQPMVMVIHGGAFYRGDKNNDNKVFLAEFLANSGYVVFNVNYRLAPSVKIKQQAEDVMAAVIWAKNHAAEYGADPNRAAVAGGSAGGLLGALVAWASDDPCFVPTGNPGGSFDSDVKVAALYYPVLDLDVTLHELGGIFAPLGKKFLLGAFRGKKYQSSIKKISPSYRVDASIPPTIFLTGDKDSLKLYPQSVAYEQKLRSLGVDTKLYTAKGKDHGFTWNYWEPESVESHREVVSFFDKYLK